MLCNAFQTLKHYRMAPNDILCGMHGQMVYERAWVGSSKEHNCREADYISLILPKLVCRWIKCRFVTLAFILFAAIAVGLILFQVKWSLLLALNSLNSQLLWYVWDSYLMTVKDLARHSTVAVNELNTKVSAFSTVILVVHSLAVTWCLRVCAAILKVKTTWQDMVRNDWRNLGE